MVDVGWQASSARALQTLLNLPAGDSARAPGGKPGEALHGNGARHRLRAFYFGTWHFARPAVEAGCRLSSYFFHLDKPHARRDLVSESVELIELFFGAPHPTDRRPARRGGRSPGGGPRRNASMARPPRSRG